MRHQKGEGQTSTYLRRSPLTRPLRSAPERIDGTGLRVWCPTTPNGSWFARRNGQSYFTGNTSLFDYHWRATLRPMAGSIASAMSRWLLPASRWRKIEFDRDEYTRPTLEDRASAWQVLNAIQDESGQVLTAEEIRTEERYGPMPANAARGVPEPAAPFGGDDAD